MSPEEEERIADEKHASQLAEALDYSFEEQEPTIRMVAWLVTAHPNGWLEPATDRLGKKNAGWHLATALACQRRGWVREDVTVASDGRTRHFNITLEGRAAVRRWQRDVRPLVDAQI